MDYEGCYSATGHKYSHEFNSSYLFNHKTFGLNSPKVDLLYPRLSLIVYIGLCDGPITYEWAPLTLMLMISQWRHLLSYVWSLEHIFQKNTNTSLKRGDFGSKIWSRNWGRSRWVEVEERDKEIVINKNSIFTVPLKGACIKLEIYVTLTQSGIVSPVLIKHAIYYILPVEDQEEPMSPVREIPPEICQCDSV